MTQAWGPLVCNRYPVSATGGRSVGGQIRPHPRKGDGAPCGGPGFPPVLPRRRRPGSQGSQRPPLRAGHALCALTPPPRPLSPGLGPSTSPLVDLPLARDYRGYHASPGQPCVTFWVYLLNI